MKALTFNKKQMLFSLRVPSHTAIYPLLGKDFENELIRRLGNEIAMKQRCKMSVSCLV